MSRSTARARCYITGALWLQILHCRSELPEHLSSLPERVFKMSERCRIDKSLSERTVGLSERAFEPPECCPPLSERFGSRGVIARAHCRSVQSHCQSTHRSTILNHGTIVAVKASLPERGRPSPKRFGSRSFIAGARSSIAGALGLQKIHCRSMVLHRQSVVAPEASLPEHIAGAPSDTVGVRYRYAGALWVSQSTVRALWVSQSTAGAHMVTAGARVFTTGAQSFIVGALWL
ncbi:hypothetical protein AMTR_s00108p00141880 [Amborella trichopoda]|uniref:Uncharacterized protein n=1 Tax=Amborella trichopoda TaxID=13333 RepID=W1NVJ6_AMBTC|nr:hypothetical protein AMTR_s00108p00141880 [Amborella trichopoda]